MVTHHNSYLVIRTFLFSIDCLQEDGVLVLCVGLHLHNNVIFGGLLVAAAYRTTEQMTYFCF